MYRLVEYYWRGGVGKATGRVLPAPSRFATIEEARRGADAVYQEVRQIPESENIFLIVFDQGDRVVYTVPDKPGRR